VGIRDRLALEFVSVLNLPLKVPKFQDSITGSNQFTRICPEMLESAKTGRLVSESGASEFRPLAGVAGFRLADAGIRTVLPDSGETSRNSAQWQYSGRLVTDSDHHRRNLIVGCFLPLVIFSYKPNAENPEFILWSKKDPYLLKG
jgi:hypothetical protein